MHLIQFKLACMDWARITFFLVGYILTRKQTLNRNIIGLCDLSQYWFFFVAKEENYLISVFTQTERGKRPPTSFFFKGFYFAHDFIIQTEAFSECRHGGVHLFGFPYEYFILNAAPCLMTGIIIYTDIK